MMATTTLKSVQEDSLTPSCWTYDAAEAADFLLVPGKDTCRLSFQDHVLVDYRLTLHFVDDAEAAREEKPSRSMEDVALDEFSCGSIADPPTQHVISLALRLCAAAISSTIEPEITVDVDGALAFDLRLKSGLLMFAELQADGSLSLTVFDDSGERASVVDHLPSATGPQFLDRL